MYELTGTEGFRLSGDTYKIHLNNARLPYENMTNQGTGGLSGIIYAQFSDLSGTSQQIAPCFTYISNVNSGAMSIAWDNGATIEQLTAYTMPSNLYVTNRSLPTGSNQPFTTGLYFSEELNDYDPTVPTFGTSLWNSFYKGLTAMMFDNDKRSVHFRAFIPEGILVNLKLQDTLIISNHYYAINAIETNYLTGESRLDLTLTGKSKLRYFTKRQVYLNNTSGNVLRVVFMNWSGVIESVSILSGQDANINLIGEIIYSSDSSVSL